MCFALPCCSFSFAGQELHSDSLTVQVCGLRNRATLNAMESPEPNKYTKSPSEYREDYESYSYTWLFSQAVSLRV